MKRLWIGIFILVLLYAGCMFVSTAFDSIHSSLSRDLEQAAFAAMQEDWATALPLARDAAARWKQYRHFTAAFADHTPMDEVDGLFAQLTAFAQERENPHFSATCQQLSLLTDSFAESHRLSWWNLL